MANIETRIPVLRVPNLPQGKMVDTNGMPTDDELSFRQTLITLLQSLFGEQGLVAPGQTAANVTRIQNNVTKNQGAVPVDQHTCAFGTILYESDTGLVKIAIEDPLGSGIPVFKTVTLT